MSPRVSAFGRYLGSLAGTALVVTACTGATSISDPVVVVPPTTNFVEPAPSPAVPAAYDTVACTSTPPLIFAVLCETFDDLLEFYVDEPDPASLAAAATLGVTSLEIQGESAQSLEGFTCVVPHNSFEVMCEAIARRSAEGPVDMASIVTAAVEGMFQFGLDPFSTYVPGDVVAAGFDASGLVVELGVVVSTRDSSGSACAAITLGCHLEILTVFNFSAAADGGVVPGDTIVAIDGVDVEGLTAIEATSILSGTPGTEVTIDLIRKDDDLVRTLVRQDIRFVPSESAILEGDIAYVRLNEFSQQAAIDLGAFLQDPDVGAARGLVLDLRDNPGGLVLAAQAVASQFLADGLVMVERGRTYVDEVPLLDGGLATSGPPMVVLVNRASASAAEVVAAVLQERGRAVVIGEPTFGKNLVQSVEETRDGGEVRITVARWETPGGLDIGIHGLEPDILSAPTGDGSVDSALKLAIDLLA